MNIIFYIEMKLISNTDFTYLIPYACKRINKQQQFESEFLKFLFWRFYFIQFYFLVFNDSHWSVIARFWLVNILIQYYMLQKWRFKIDLTRLKS